MFLGQRGPSPNSDIHASCSCSFLKLPTPQIYVKNVYKGQVENPCDHAEERSLFFIGGCGGEVFVDADGGLQAGCGGFDQEADVAGGAHLHIICWAPDSTKITKEETRRRVLIGDNGDLIAPGPALSAV